MYCYKICDCLIFPFQTPACSEECHLQALTGICIHIPFTLWNSPSFLHRDSNVFESDCSWVFCLPFRLDFSPHNCVCWFYCSGHTDKPSQFPYYCLHRLMGLNYFSFFFSSSTVSPIYFVFNLFLVSVWSFKDIWIQRDKFLILQQLCWQRTTENTTILRSSAWMCLDVLIFPSSGKLWDLSSWVWFQFSVSIFRL